MVRVMDGDSRIESVQQNLKIPPNSVEAEQSILGGLMIAKVAWEKISDLIVESDFYRKDHKIIFSVISCSLSLSSRVLLAICCKSSSV